MNDYGYRKLAETIAGGKSFLVLTHENPDGDAIGSAAAAAEFIAANGMDAGIALPSSLPDKYKFLADKIIGLGAPKPIQDYDAVLCLDSASLERVYFPDGADPRAAKMLVNIDHHPDNTGFGKLNFVDSSASATAQILFAAFRMIPGSRIAPSVAESLLAGLIMDTGCFRFDNTGEKAMMAAAEMISLGADCPSLVGRLYFSRPLNYARFEADIILNRLRVDLDGQYGWIILDDEILGRYSLTKKDTEDLIDAVRAIAGIRVAAVLNRTQKGVKFSLRSKDRGVSVGKIARSLGGGGHEMAAGGTIAAESLPEAGKILSLKVEEILKGADVDKSPSPRSRNGK